MKKLITFQSVKNPLLFSCSQQEQDRIIDNFQPLTCNSHISADVFAVAVWSHTPDVEVSAAG